MKNPIPIHSLASVLSCVSCLSWFLFLAPRATAEVGQWFAGKLLADTPVRLELSAAAALAPWRMMNAAGMTEREDGSRDVSFSAPGAPGISGVYRMRDGGAPGGRALPVGADLRAARGGSGAEPPSFVEAEWVFTPEADMRMEMFGLMGDLRMEDYGGGSLLVEDEHVPLPKEGAPEDVRRTGVSRLALMDSDGDKRLDFAFHEPINLFVQYWGGKAMSLRFILPPDDPATHLYRGGRARTLAFALSGAGPHRKSTLKPVKLAAGPDWIPFDASGGIAEGSALDFSEMRPTGKPCGVFGRVVARGPHFEFEGVPGVPQRFYGVNLCMSANYPESLDDARSLARTLARVGYNSVRIHHHDGYCIDKADPTATRLDEESMRRMDALVTACTEEGLYISTDLFVSRTRLPIAWRAVGVDRDGTLSMQDFKYTVHVHEGVYSNFLAFVANWLGHVNAYTGRRYAEEPALAWISLVNEGNIDDMSGYAFAGHPGWQEAWDAWRAAKRNEQRKKENEQSGLEAGNNSSSSILHSSFDWDGITSELPNGLGKNRQGRAFLVFLQDVEARFVARTRRFLADLGCHALITDMNNCGQMTAAFEKVRAEAFDYVDTHFYVDHPRFLEKDWSRPSWCPNENPFKGAAMGAAVVSAVRILDRPFTVSEYNFCGPGRYRGVGGIAVGAEAALQDWAGLWRFAWAHGIEDALHPGAGAAGYFNIATDPLQMASERASVCLFLRGDAEPLETTYAVTLPPDRISSPDAMIGEGTRVDWVAAAWRAKIGAVMGSVGSLPPSFVHAGDFDAAYAKGTAEVMCELDAATVAGGLGARPPVIVTNGVFLIDTPRTCGVFAEGGEHTAGVLSVKLGGVSRAESASEATPRSPRTTRENLSAPKFPREKEVPATIWASSLDGAPLRVSRRILLTHLTDVQNTGASYADADMTVLKDFGRLPYLMRTGRADVALSLAGDAGLPRETHLKPQGNLQPEGRYKAAERGNFIGEAASGGFAVYALAPDGTHTAEIPATFSDGVLCFTADIARDPASATFLYEIVR